jgi:hypothetical protein
MRWVALVIFLPTLVSATEVDFSWTNPRVAYYLPAFYSTSGKSEMHFEKFERHLEKLKERESHFDSDHAFLKYIFVKTHQRFLKNFNATSRFDQLFKNGGSYNCLTATALLALTLEHFAFDYEIIETNYHIFLTVNVDGKKVLIETTDLASGFVDDEASIKERMARYRSHGVKSSDGSKTYFKFTSEVYRGVNLSELLGLLNYNLAVEAYNQGQIASSIDFLKASSSLYHSDRVKEFYELLSLTIREAKLTMSEKKELLIRLTDSPNKT